MNAQPRGLGRITDIETIQTETLVGDVRDLILQEMRDAKEGLPWTTRTERQQAEMIDRADRFAKGVIAKIVNLVAAGDNPAVPVTIKKWEVSDELKVALTGAASTTNIVTMMDGGGVGFLVFADKEPFNGEREPVRPAKDQGTLPGHDEDGVVFDNTPAGK